MCVEESSIDRVRPNGGHASDVSLNEIARRYFELEAEVKTLRESGHATADDATCETRLNDLLDEMHQITWRIATIEASSREEVRTKATVVWAWLQDAEDDLTTELAKSVCEDIKSTDHSDDNHTATS